MLYTTVYNIKLSILQTKLMYSLWLVNHLLFILLVNSQEYLASPELCYKRKRPLAFQEVLIIYLFLL